MSAASKALLAVLALAVVGCGGSPQEPVQANDAAVVSDIEQLPADESVATTTDELANGVDEPPPDPMAGNETSP